VNLNNTYSTDHIARNKHTISHSNNCEQFLKPLEHNWWQTSQYTRQLMSTVKNLFSKIKILQFYPHCALVWAGIARVWCLSVRDADIMII